MATLVGGLGGACGDGGGGSDGGSPFPDGGPAADANLAEGGAPVVLFVSDRSLAALFRMEDRNGDGDFHDADESIRFFDDEDPRDLVAPRGLVAFDARDVVAAHVPGDGEPSELLRLRDLDQDGDATSVGEASIWFDGAAEPGGFAGIIALVAGPADDLFALEQGATRGDDSRVHRIADADADTAIEPNEVDPVYNLGARSSEDAAVDGQGTLWLLERDERALGLARVPSGGPMAIALEDADLARAHGLTFATPDRRLAAGPDDTLYAETLRSASGFSVLVAMRDADRDGLIAADREVRQVWDESLHLARPSNFAVQDVAVGPDGSLFVLVSTQGVIHRFFDGNGDGDYDDPGEDRVIYDTARAVAEGGENTADLLGFAIAAAE